LDLRTYLRVIWRFRLVVGVGLILAIILAGVSYLKISFHGGKPSISYRQSQTFKATTVLALGSANAPVGSPATFMTNNPTGFATQAFIYANLARSDTVERMARRGGLTGSVISSPTIDQTTRVILPFVEITALADSALGAVTLANRDADALRTYVRDQQDTGATPSGLRVSLTPVERATGASIWVGRKKTTPIVIFLTVLIAAIGLAFILENLRPRVHVVGRDVEELPPAAGQRAG
jgi:hypothetical protein